jgi:hypothetical protein
MKLLRLILALALASSPAGAAIHGSSAVPTLMVTPILSQNGGSGTPPSNTVVNYGFINGNAAGSNWNAAETATQMPFPVSGTLSNLTVRFPTAVAAGTASTCNGVLQASPCYGIQLRVGGVTQTMGCVITSASLTCTDNSNTYAVSPGQIINYISTPAGTPTAQVATLPVQVSMVFTSSVGNESPLLSSWLGGNLPATGIQYVAMVGGSTTGQTTESIASSVMPAAGTVDHLYVQSSTGGPGAGASWTFTIYQNGNPTAEGCTLSGSQVQCNDPTNSITVAAGDTLSLQVCPSNTATCPAGSAPGGRSSRLSSRWIPSTPGQSIVSVNTQTTINGAAGATRWQPVDGPGSTTSTEVDYIVVPVGLTIRNLYESQAVAPGGSSTRAWTFRDNNVSHSPVCTVTSLVTSCQDLSGSFSTSTNDLIDWQFTNSGAQAASTWTKLSAVVTVP